jgi:hypothetical protein
MARGRDEDQEWRRSVGQSEGQVARPEPWRFAATNALPFDLQEFPRREIELEVPAEAEPDQPFDAQYIADAKVGVANARASYRRLMRVFWTLRFGVIASGLLVAVLSAAGTPVWTVATFGALAAALEAVMVSTNLQNRAVVRGLYADAVARELRTFSLKLDPYADADAIRVLHGKLEALRDSASSTQFKLDQAAAGDGKS